MSLARSALELLPIAPDSSRICTDPSNFNCEFSRVFDFGLSTPERSPHRSGGPSCTKKLESLSRRIDLIVVLSTGESCEFALVFVEPRGFAWQEHLSTLKLDGLSTESHVLITSWCRLVCLYSEDALGPSFSMRGMPEDLSSMSILVGSWSLH